MQRKMVTTQKPLIAIINADLKTHAPTSNPTRQRPHAKAAAFVSRANVRARIKETPNPALKRDAPPAMQAPRPLALR